MILSTAYPGSHRHTQPRPHKSDGRPCQRAVVRRFEATVLPGVSAREQPPVQSALARMVVPRFDSGGGPSLSRERTQ